MHDVPIKAPNRNQDIKQWERGTGSLTFSLRETKGINANVQSVWLVLFRP